MVERVFDAPDFQVYSIEGAPTDGSFITGAMTPSYEQGYISVVFYTDQSKTTPTNPTQGTVAFEGSETGVQYGEISAPINASTFGEASTYTRPVFAGPIKFVRVTFAASVDAAWFEMRVGRYCRG